MGQSVMKIQFLEDGRVKITTIGEVAEEHHLQADQMLEHIQKLTGGGRETEHLKDPAMHHHHHGEHGHRHSHHH